MDPQFLNHRAEYMLGLILIARHDTGEGSHAQRCASILRPHPDQRDVAVAKTATQRARERNGQLTAFYKKLHSPLR